VGDVLEGLDRLVEQNLVQPSEAAGPPRFTMLETIREFAIEQLESSEGSYETLRRHGAFFLELAERANTEALSGDPDSPFDRLDSDLDNLRAAIDRATAASDLPAALSIATALERFWLLRNHSAEGRQILARLVDHPDAPDGPELAWATGAATDMEVWLGNYEAGRRLGERGVAAFRRIGDRAGLVNPLTSYGFAMIEVDPEKALTLIDESLDLARDVGDARLEATIPLARAVALLRLGRFADARVSLEQAVEGSRRVGDSYFETMSRYALARTELLMGDTAKAMEDYASAIEDSRSRDLRLGVAVGLDNYAEIALTAGDVRRAVRLASAAGRMKEELGGGPPAQMIGATDPLVAGREQLGAKEFAREVAAGRAMDLDSTITEARALESAP
jgi:predicted ATPase